MAVRPAAGTEGRSGWIHARPQSADHPRLRHLRSRTGSGPAARNQASVSAVRIMGLNGRIHGTITAAHGCRPRSTGCQCARCSCVAETPSRNAVIKRTAHRDRCLPLRRPSHLSSSRIRLNPCLPSRLHDTSCIGIQSTRSTPSRLCQMATSSSLLLSSGMPSQSAPCSQSC